MDTMWIEIDQDRHELHGDRRLAVVEMVDDSTCAWTVRAERATRSGHVRNYGDFEEMTLDHGKLAVHRVLARRGLQHLIPDTIAAKAPV